LEHGPSNPINEQENPVESIKRLREVADEYDLEVALGPDHNFAISHAAAMAPYADYIILQIQKVQTEPETVYDFVLPVLEEVRRENPDIKTSVQIRTEGDIDDLLQMLEPLQNELDGISILTSDETVSIAQELVSELRALPAVPTPSSFRATPPSEVEEPSTGNNPLPIEEINAADEVLPATIVAAVLDIDDNTSSLRAPQKSTASSGTESSQERINDSSESGSAENNEVISTVEPLSTPESNQRTGSTWLFVAIALIVGFALGAGYVNYRASR